MALVKFKKIHLSHFNSEKYLFAYLKTSLESYESTRDVAGLIQDLKITIEALKEFGADYGK